VRELLDKGAGEITESDAGNAISHEPAIRAELLTAMGQAYTGLGLYEPARSLLDLAMNDDMAGVVTGEARVRTLTADGTALFLDGKYMEAAKPLADAVNLARTALDPSNAVRTEALTADADNLVQLGNLAQAIQLCLVALEADRKRGPEDAPILANTLDSLGIAYLSSGDPGTAEAPLREALQLREKALGLHHARTADSINNLGADLYQAGRYEESMAEYQLALPIFREIYGDEHPAVATLINNIGRSALMAGHVDEAEPLLRQALVMTEKFEGESHDDLIAPLNSLAMIDAFRGKIDAALQEIRQAEALARMPDQGELLDQVLINRASFDLARGDSGDASKVLAEARATLQMLHPDAKQEAWRYAEWDVVNSGLLAEEGNLAAAEQTLSAAREVLRARFGAHGFYSVLADRQALAIQKPAPGSKRS
jgi:tetratricopeptide (TPR) repeat protein